MGMTEGEITTLSDDAATTRTTIVVTIPFPPELLERLGRRFPTVEVVGPVTDELAGVLTSADAVVGWHLSDEDLAAAKRLRWLHSTGAGVDRTLTPALVARGITVTNSSGLHADNIAEHLLAMMLAFGRGLPDLIRAQIRRTWLDEELDGRVFELGGQTLLLVGLGDIALATAPRAAALGMRVVGVRRRSDRPVPPGLDAVFGVERLPELIGDADHVAICLPLTARTRGLFDAKLLARMRPSAYLYNIGRGPIVDQDALIAALRDGRLAGAGLDVTDPEPLPAESPLWELENVLITAHTSGRTPRYLERAYAILEDNVARFVNGDPLRNVVDQSEGY
ncbi:MAG: D-3-phosphoglycerate dehydrogenase [uncultured Thermomicrobiales bacterium]|uniref:D-3-phosphoglycerate dehydrogenase n=1 Tax=uncultured Thermomicrobiales bacterium TaxID=1645740 RepID=A0A6J4UEF4_9BACT|nr:MAG: D-3-phosphoglycerate dehydrogenase [uncultured Thermomicrobiales bacterium]